MVHDASGCDNFWRKQYIFLMAHLCDLVLSINSSFKMVKDNFPGAKLYCPCLCISESVQLNFVFFTSNKLDMYLRWGTLMVKSSQLWFHHLWCMLKSRKDLNFLVLGGNFQKWKFPSLTSGEMGAGVGAGGWICMDTMLKRGLGFWSVTCMQKGWLVFLLVSMLSSFMWQSVEMCLTEFILI